MGEAAALALLERMIAARSVRLDAPHAFAHMDPPPPRVAVELAARMAGRNENMLHPDLSPLGTEAEARVIGWLAPFFGMAAGHMTGGATISNLAALWAAREAGARRVVASAEAHLSVPKAAHILGLPFAPVSCRDGALDAEALPDLSDAALVLTAGTTGRGAIDPLHLRGGRWTHVDAAWAGPLRLTRHAALLDGIEGADSVAVSAHKWLWQPKDSALVLFRDAGAQDAIAFGGAYLATPNVGVQGSRGAAAVPLLGTLLAFGRAGIAARIERGMRDAAGLADWIEADPRLTLLGRPATGVVCWRAEGRDMAAVLSALGPTASRLLISGAVWARHVAANPHVEIDAVIARIDAALEVPPRRDPKTGPFVSTT
jgi:glutamate/tyrosine decarboxylase-like PLP-dependent enzyme